MGELEGFGVAVWGASGVDGHFTDLPVLRQPSGEPSAFIALRYQLLRGEGSAGGDVGVFLWEVDRLGELLRGGLGVKGNSQLHSRPLWKQGEDD